MNQGRRSGRRCRATNVAPLQLLQLLQSSATLLDQFAAVPPDRSSCPTSEAALSVRCVFPFPSAQSFCPSAGTHRIGCRTLWASRIATALSFQISTSAPPCPRLQVFRIPVDSQSLRENRFRLGSRLGGAPLLPTSVDCNLRPVPRHNRYFQISGAYPFFGIERSLPEHSPCFHQSFAHTEFAQSFKTSRQLFVRRELSPFRAVPSV